MEHLIATFDVRPPEAIIQTLIKEHDSKLALYDGHVERTAFAIVDDKHWKAIKTTGPWRHCSNDDDCVYHQISAFKTLKPRYPNITSQTISAPAMLAACPQIVMTLSG